MMIAVLDEKIFYQTTIIRITLWQKGVKPEEEEAEELNHTA